MPRGDGTGPMGMGPMTGRAAGFCNDYSVPGYFNPMHRCVGFGRGRGYRRMYCATGMPVWGRSGYPVYQPEYTQGVNEKDFLNQQVESMESELMQLKKRLSEIEKGEE